MRHLAAAGSLLPIAFVASMAAGVRVDGPQTTNAVHTFNQHVAPILFAHCVACHRSGEIAPMSLLSYDEVRPWARAIKARVLTREMPPWPADPLYGRFANEHRLTDAQIATLAAWVDGGAPRGTGSPPAPPKFQPGWTSRADRPPDLVIDAPLHFDRPSSGEIPVFTVWTKLPLRHERFIDTIELRPTNRALVHHAAVFLAALPRGAKLGRAEAWPNGPLVDGIPVLSDGTRAALPPDGTFETPLVFYVPAGGVLRLRSDVVKRARPDDYLMWTFHLVPARSAEQPGARIGLWFRDNNVHHEAVTRTVSDRIFVNGVEIARGPNGPQFPAIAPHQSEYTVTGLVSVKEDLTIYSLWPHMHLRGRDMTFSVIDPKGHEDTVLSVPRYDFNWQFNYELKTPLKVKAGSTIKAVAHYDNSSANRFNPDPGQEVIWGQQADNEMFNPFVELVYDDRLLSDCGSFGQPQSPIGTAPAGNPNRCP